MDENEIFLKILQENMLYLRHQETQRMWTANIFIAIVVGTLVYSIHVGLENVSWFIPLAFFIISTLCLLITLKLNKVFSETLKLIRNIFEKNRISIKNVSVDWGEYVAGVKPSGGPWAKIRVRHLYNALYLIAMAASLVFLIVVLVD